MDTNRCSTWVYPYEYDRRSRSLNDATQHVRTTTTKDPEDGPTIAGNIVDTGLSLAGTGLVGNGSLPNLESVNAATVVIDDSTGQEAFDTPIYLNFDSRVPPVDDAIVDDLFNQLLEDKSFFWGAASKNLQGMSKERKWDLICKIHFLEYNGSKDIDTESNLHKNEQRLLTELESRLKDSNRLLSTLYSLERQLRQKAFCELFLKNGHLNTLASYASTIPLNEQYVYLNCFKAVLNFEQGRQCVLESTTFLEHLSSLICSSSIHIKIRTLSTELLLLLSYCSEHLGHQIIANVLNDSIASWFEAITTTLIDPGNDTTCNSMSQSHPFLFTTVDKLITDYACATVFLINSIQESMATKEARYKNISLYKKHKIHKLLHLAEKLGSPTIEEQCKLYRSAENDMMTNGFELKIIPDGVLFASVLSRIIKQAQSTLLEKPLGNLLTKLLQLMETRTISEVVGILQALHSISQHLSENFDSRIVDISDGAPSALDEAIHRLMDSLEANSISKRTVHEIEGLEDTVNKLRKENEDIKEKFKLTEQSELLRKISELEDLCDSKDVEIQSLMKKIDWAESQRRLVQKKYDLEKTHTERPQYGNLTTNVFQNLKSHDMPISKKPSSKGIFKSYRVGSLSAYLNTDPNDADSKKSGHELNMSTIDPVSGNTSNSSENSVSFSLEPETKHKPQSLKPPALPDFLQVLPSSKEDACNIEDFDSNFVSALPPPPPPPMPDNLAVASSTELTGAPAAPPPPSFLVGNKSIANGSAKKLKQIHWDTVEDIDETLWQNNTQRVETSRELEYGGIFSELETSFKVKDVIIKPSSKKKSQGNPNLVSFLSRDLAQQFGINLHVFSQYTELEFVDKVLRCDNDVIQNISVLEFFNKEELVQISPSLIRNYGPYSTDYMTEEGPSKTPDELQRPDRIFLELCFNLREYWSERSQCLLVLATYEKDYYDLLYKLQKIDDATQRLQYSERFRNLLYIIIEIGNYMNKKPASGLRISSLPKLVFIKSSTDNNMSFLHFIERLVRTRYMDVYGFVDDLAKVEELGRLTLEHIRQECEDFSKKIDHTIYSITRGKLSDPTRLHPNDKILEKVKFKVNRVRTKSELLQDQLCLTNHAIDKLLKYFGEDPRNTEVKNEFFHTLTEFLANFRKCAKENIERENVERMNKQRKQILETRKADASRQENESDAVDDLLARLRDASTKEMEPLRRRRSAKQLSSSNENVASETLDGNLLQRAQALLNDTQKI